jgi:hypothetical protein
VLLDHIELDKKILDYSRLLPAEAYQAAEILPRHLQILYNMIVDNKKSFIAINRPCAQPIPTPKACSASTA